MRLFDLDLNIDLLIAIFYCYDFNIYKLGLTYSHTKPLPLKKPNGDVLYRVKSWLCKDDFDPQKPKQPIKICMKLVFENRFWYVIKRITQHAIWPNLLKTKIQIRNLSMFIMKSFEISVHLTLSFCIYMYLICLYVIVFIYV